MKKCRAITAVMVLAAFLVMTGCRTHYAMTGIERSRILVDKRYDAHPDAQAQQIIAPFKVQVDSIMSPVVGRVTKYMAAKKPESELSNLLTDILVWGGKPFGEKPDFAVYNVGGMRAAFAQGDVTVGDVVDVAPFENKICFLTLTGDKVLELFQQIAGRGGEGVSHGVELVINGEGRLLSACLHGKDIEPTAEYRVATLDFLAQGNDGLTAFRSGTNVVSPQTEENNVRYIIMNYFREKAAQGQAVDSKLEGRIIMEGEMEDMPMGN